MMFRRISFTSTILFVAALLNAGVFAQEDQGWPHSSLNYRPPAPEAIQPTNDLTRIAIGLTQKKWYNNRGQVTLEARL